MPAVDRSDEVAILRDLAARGSERTLTVDWTARLNFAVGVFMGLAANPNFSSPAPAFARFLSLYLDELNETFVDTVEHAFLSSVAGDEVWRRRGHGWTTEHRAEMLSWARAQPAPFPGIVAALWRNQILN